MYKYIPGIQIHRDSLIFFFGATAIVTRIALAGWATGNLFTDRLTKLLKPRAYRTHGNYAQVRYR